jgi:hypothetical protein
LVSAIGLEFYAGDVNWRLERLGISMGHLSEIATRGFLACSGAGTTSTTSAGSAGGPGLGSFDWPVILGLMCGAAVVALVSAGLTLLAARGLPPVQPPIPVWPASS